MPFYTYIQNNSGGIFLTDRQSGISHYVIIEADTAKEANRKAEDIGLYFDGRGDCHCCGSRWDSMESYWDNSDSTPMIYDQDISSGIYYSKDYAWIKDGPEGYIHYKNGVIVPITVQKLVSKAKSRKQSSK